MHGNVFPSVLRPSDPFTVFLTPLSTSSPSAVTVQLCFLKGEESSQSVFIFSCCNLSLHFHPHPSLCGFPPGPYLLTFTFNISQTPDSGTTALTLSIGLESGENFTLCGEILGPQRSRFNLCSNSIFFSSYLVSVVDLQQSKCFPAQDFSLAVI